MMSFVDRCVCLERAHTGDCVSVGVNSGIVSGESARVFSNLV
jgi:hypothetical protein